MNALSWIGLVVASGLFFYLTVALVKPEWFS